jgi:hypothetical protein
MPTPVHSSNELRECILPSPCGHSVSTLVGVSSPSSPSDYTSLPTPLSSILRLSSRLIHDNKLMLIFTQGSSSVKDHLCRICVYSNVPLSTFSHAYETPSFIVLVVADILSR